MRVLKFGGSSVGTPDAVRQVIEIVRKKRRETPVVVVVSAFRGVTDLLTEAATRAAAGDEGYLKSIRELETRHVQAIKDLVCVQNQSSLLTRFKLELNQMEDILQGISLIREITPKTMDVLLGFGERFSAMILAGALNDHDVPSDYVDARDLIRTDDNHGQARVLVEPTWTLIQAGLRDPERVQVVTGFIAATEEGIPTTLGRGGSDYTAALIGAALEVEIIEIWTDVDGMMTADPGKVKRAFSIEEVSYEEAMEMSHFGARVIYPPTIQPALKAGIPIQIKNTFSPDQPGTLITKDAKPSKRPIKGLSSIDEVALITIKGSGMIGVSGIAARLFTTLAREKINILLITQASSEHTVTLAVLPRMARQAERAIRKEFQLELHEEIIDDVLVELDLSVIAIVGDHMRQIPGIAGRVFSAIGRNGINIVAIAQGSSERNISFVIRRQDQSKAMNTLHDAFFLAGVKTVNLYLVGVGLIGGTLLRLIQNQVDTLYDEYLIDVKLRGVANSRDMLVREEPIPMDRWEETLESHGEASSLSSFIEKMKEQNLPNSVYIDCTASEEVSAHYPEILSSSISVVTPNKKANSSTQEYFRELDQLARRHNVAFRYETNVGAGLPLIGTLHELVTTGDKLRRVEGVLSGTLSYLFNSFDGSTPFSEVVRQAREKGYTEPDPREDLNGFDVGRKLLILARVAGYELEFDDLEIENLVPEGARDADDVESFFEQMKAHDGEFEEMLNQAKSEGKKLCYIARFDGKKAVVKLERIGPDHPFYSLQGSDNIVALYTDHYQESPMVIKGPGAGANVTAGGIVADILRVVNTKVYSNAG